jgi:uroporphyrinogen decarboxylase
MIAGWAAVNFSDLPLSDLAKNPEAIAKAQIRAREEVGNDALFCYADALFVPEAFGCKVRYPSTGPLVDPLPRTIASIEDVEHFPFPNPRNAGRLPLTLEVVNRLNDFGKGDIPVLGAFEGAFTTTCRVMETDLIMRMTHKNRPVLEGFLDRMNDFLQEFGRALIENGANVLFIPEPTSSCSMISPKMFRDIVLPRLQKLTSELTVPCVLHICGDTTPILEHMVKTGAHVLSLDQCMNLSDARKRVPDVAIGGNVDPIQSLLMGGKERVKEDTLNCLRTAGTSRYVMMSGCGVPPHSPVENLKNMVRTAVEYGLGTDP